MDENELKELRIKVKELEEQLKSSIPRRRVRRIYKSLKTILEADLENENKKYIEELKTFINKIEKEGPQIADQNIKTAIEHLLSTYDLPDDYIIGVDFGEKDSFSIRRITKY